jgi:hypothetical protein
MTVNHYLTWISTRKLSLFWELIHCTNKIVHHIKCRLHYLQHLRETSWHCGYLTKCKDNYATIWLCCVILLPVAGFAGTANSMPASTLVISKAFLVAQENFKIFISISQSLADDRAARGEFRIVNRICVQCWWILNVETVFRWHNKWGIRMLKGLMVAFSREITRNSLDILCDSVWKQCFGKVLMWEYKVQSYLQYNNFNSHLPWSPVPMRYKTSKIKYFDNYYVYCVKFNFQHLFLLRRKMSLHCVVEIYHYEEMFL